MTDRIVPPHDLDAEAAVISACMIDDQAVDALEGRLRADHFYAESHRRIFEAILHQNARGAPADIVHVGTHLKDTGRIGQVGGMAYLTEIINAAPSVANVAKYGDIVRGKWRAREVIRAAQQVVRDGYVGVPADKLLEQGDAAFFMLGRDGEHANSVERLGGVIRTVAKTTMDQHKAGQVVTGYPTGFERLDRMTGGMHAGDLTIVAARPGMGKTSLVLNIATNVGSRRMGAGVWSLEMPREQLAQRMICSEGRIDLWKARTASMRDHDWARYNAAAAHLDKLPVYVDDTAGITLSALRAKARRLQLAMKREGVELATIIVDYLQLMSTDDVAPNESNVAVALGKVSRGLKVLAKELRVSVIALSQLNRSVETRAGKKRPQMSDLRDSGAIEQDADNIIFVYRDEYYGEEREIPKLAELIIAKQRNGPTGTVKVRFDKEYTRFDNIAEAEYPEEE